MPSCYSEGGLDTVAREDRAKGRTRPLLFIEPGLVTD